MSPVDAPPTLISFDRVGRDFDVSRPWLERTLGRLPRKTLVAADEVSFEIPRGRTLALVGESGCGKSTVGRLAVGLYSPTRGRVLFDGRDISRSRGPELAGMRRRMQMIFQDPHASLNPRWRVEDIVAEPLRVLGLVTSRAEGRRKVGELLEQVGLSAADARKFPHQFSGGQRQRISIARALSSSPEFLVCDEPTSALDVSVQAQVLNLMRDLQARLGLTYLFISHNLAVVEYVADTIGVMYLGRIVELGPATDILERPVHPYTRMLLAAIPNLEMTGIARTPVAGEVPNPIDRPTGCAFHPRCPEAGERCRAAAPDLLPDGDRRAVACWAA
ncbi:MAG: ATP-binding cassette domain-containing protein [Betaproteobacteria bacterium]|nr:ATP-binding cassette domain-containing protein [Betaproteobacteria bacterium]